MADASIRAFLKNDTALTGAAPQRFESAQNDLASILSARTRALRTFFAVSASLVEPENLMFRIVRSERVSKSLPRSAACPSEFPFARSFLTTQ